MLKPIKQFSSIIAGAILAISVPTAAQSQTVSEVTCLARVIHHEAGGESRLGQAAVGYVVINRVRSGRYANNICSVVTQPQQFSNFNVRRSLPSRVELYFTTIARQVIQQYSPTSDPTRGALHFRSGSARAGRGLVHTITIGGHRFYR